MKFLLIAMNIVSRSALRITICNIITEVITISLESKQNKFYYEYDIVITKVNAAGSALIGSVAIGGSSDDGVNIRKKFDTPDGAETTRRNYGDDARSEVLLDGGNNILVTSCTQSSNFPVAGSPIQTTYGGGKQDGVILKFNPDLSARIFSTFFGGSGSDACFVQAINPLTGNLYVAGGTSSSDLPGNKTGVIDQSFQGGEVDGFVTQIVT